MIERILVTHDGSELAESVLPHVEDLAKRLSAEVVFLRVVELHAASLALQAAPDAMAGAEMNYEIMSEELEAETKAAEDSLARLASDWQARGISANWAVVRGQAAPSITEFAHSRGIDLIAMSTHGRSGLSRLIFGSVVEQVVNEAGLPVLVVRPVDKEEESSDKPE